MGRTDRATIIIQIRGGRKAAGAAGAVAAGMAGVAHATGEASDEALKASASLEVLEHQLAALARQEQITALSGLLAAQSLHALSIAAIALAVVTLPALLSGLWSVAGAMTIVAGVFVAGLLAMTAGAGLMAAGVVSRFQTMKEQAGSAARDLVDQASMLRDAFVDATAAGSDHILTGLADGLRSLVPMVSSLRDSFTAVGKATGGALRDFFREVAGMGPQINRMLQQLGPAIQAAGPFLASFLRLFLKLGEIGLPLVTSALQTMTGWMDRLGASMTPERVTGAFQLLGRVLQGVKRFFGEIAAVVGPIIGPAIREVSAAFGQIAGPAGRIIGTILAGFLQLGRILLPSVVVLFKAIDQAFGGIAGKMQGLDTAKIGGALAGGLSAVLKGVGTVARGAVTVVRSVLDAIKPAEPFLKNVLLPLLEGLLIGVIASIKPLWPLFKQLMVALGAVGNAMAPFAGVFRVVGAVIGFVFAGPILKLIGGVAKLIGIGMKGIMLFGKLGAAIVAAGRVMSSAGVVLVRLGGIFSKIFGRIFGLATAFARRVGGAIGSVVTALTRTGSLALLRAELIGRNIIRGIAGLPARVLQIGRSIMGALARGMGSAVGVITEVVKTIVNSIGSVWNSTVGKIHFKTPKWLPGLGGKGFSMPKIPQLATGGIATAGGLAWVGEQGPELVSLPTGAGVLPNRPSMQLAARTKPLPSNRHAPSGTPAPAGDYVEENHHHIYMDGDKFFEAVERRRMRARGLGAF